MRKILVVVNVLLMSMLLACGEETEISQQEIKGSDDGTEHMTFRVSVYQGDKARDDYRTKWLAEKFNVTLDIVPISWAQRIQQSRVWMSTGKVPDIMWYLVENGGITPHEVQEAVEGGLFQEIPFEDYPNLANLYNNKMQDIKDYIDVDGKTYYWTSYRDFPIERYPTTKEGGVPYSLHTWLYRRDWAEKLGLANEDDIYTQEEFLNMLKAFMEQDPGNNGDGNTIGATFVNWGVPAYFTKLGGLYQGTLVHTKADDGSYVWAMDLPKMREAWRQAKTFYDEVVWKDQIASSGSDGEEKFNAGLAGAVYGFPNLGNTAALIKGLEGRDPNIDVGKAVRPLYIKNDNGKIYQHGIPLDYWGGWSISSKVEPARVDRWMKIMDYLAGEEGARLTIYGLEGQDYEIDGDEVRVLWKKNDQGNPIKPFTPKASRFLSYPILRERFSPFLPGVNPFVASIYQQEKDTLETDGLGELIPTDMRQYIISSIITKESKPLPDMNQLTKAFIIDLFSNQNAEDFDTLYDEFLEKNKDNATQVINEINEINERFQ